MITAVIAQDRGRLLAALIAGLGDFQRAEDALQEAVELALVHWRRTGVPDSPLGWLLKVARRKALDGLRREANFARKSAEIALLSAVDAGEDEPDIADQRLALIFACCHPALEPKTRVALTLRTIGGLSTGEIAAAFLDREAAMGQRLSRAKAKIRAAGIPYAVPGPELWAERLHSVLTVIYLIFNEGYSAGEGDAPVRMGLCEEAIWLARMVDGLRPGEAEVEGLLALMLLGHARRGARCGAEGEAVMLRTQDRDKWDSAMMQEGLAVLDRAVARLAGGPYQIQAAISALHMAGPAGATDWRQILLLYDTLYRMAPNPVVALNRAVALGEVAGAGAALAELAGLAAELEAYQPYHAARAALLVGDGQVGAARSAYQQAIDLSRNAMDIRYLTRQRDEVTG
jgi:RNA polymerase sigma-70 factor (ECF subfamily)